MAIENLILDIGNVICRWDPGKLVASTFTDSARAKQAHAATIGHPDWLELDRGTLALEAAISAAQQRSELDASGIARIYHNTAPSLVPVDSTVGIIRALHAQGVPLYVLSNMQAHCWQYLSESFDFWTCFTGIVVSCDVNLIKPDPAIYQYVLETHGLDPAVTAFVDDMQVNIDAARDAGIHGVVLEHPDDGSSVINGLFTTAAR